MGTRNATAEDQLSERWRAEGLAYSNALNSYIERGYSDGWKTIRREDEPQDPRAPLAKAVLEAVRRANAANSLEGLRERFPPAHSPFLDMLEENGQPLPSVFLLDDGRILTRIGEKFNEGIVAIVDGNRVITLPSEMLGVGRSPNRRFFAVARKREIDLLDGWEGKKVGSVKWPPGIILVEGRPYFTQLIPFDDGERILLVTETGIFVTSSAGGRRLVPPENPSKAGDSCSLAMEHGALSPDGRWIACGHQDSKHLIFDAATLELAGEAEPLADYPCHAFFNKSASLLALNACIGSSGATIGVATQHLPGLKIEPSRWNDRFPILDPRCRVHAAVARGGEFVVGDAKGFLIAFNETGQLRWLHHIGSTVSSMDISRDEKRLVVTTCAGFLCSLDLDTGERDPFAISTASHRERFRWLFWKEEPRPLRW